MLYKELLNSLVGKKGILYSRNEGTSIFIFHVSDSPRDDDQITEVHDDYVVIAKKMASSVLKNVIPMSLFIVEYY